MKKYLTGLLALAIVISGIGANSAFAQAPLTYHLNTVDADAGPDYVTDFDFPSTNLNNCYLMGIKPTTFDSAFILPNTGLTCDGGALNVDNVPQTHVTGLAASLANTSATFSYIQGQIALATSSIAAEGASELAMNSWYTGMSTTTINLASPTANGIMVAADKTKLNNLVQVQRTRVTADASGNYTWTFPTAYASGQAPIVSVVAEDSSGSLSNVQITAVSNTSVTIHAGKITSALGILSLASNASIPVDITAVPQ